MTTTTLRSRSEGCGGCIAMSRESWDGPECRGVGANGKRATIDGPSPPPGPFPYRNMRGHQGASSPSDGYGRTPTEALPWVTSLNTPASVRCIDTGAAAPKWISTASWSASESSAA